MEVIVVRQIVPFLCVNAMVSTYTTYPRRQMDVSKLTVEMVGGTGKNPTFHNKHRERNT